jgi:peptidoglycan biosynthesis protein MviN/MurJ (putative lipid II flippase)
MGVDGLALASTVAITLYTGALAVLWYHRTGWQAARSVGVVAVRNLPIAALAGVAAWAVAEWIMGSFAEPGLASSLVGAGVGGLVLLAIALAPPSVRRDLRR